MEIDFTESVVFLKDPESLYCAFQRKKLFYYDFFRTDIQDSGSIGGKRIVNTRQLLQFFRNSAERTTGSYQHFNSCIKGLDKYFFCIFGKFLCGGKQCTIQILN